MEKNIIMPEYSLVESFKSYLINEKGYPESAIKTEYQSDEYPLSRKLRGDIVILRGKAVVQAFELKTRNDSRTIENGLHQVEVISQYIGSEDYKVPTYLVTVDNAGEYTFYDIEHKSHPIRDKDKILNYHKAVRSYIDNAMQTLKNDTFLKETEKKCCRLTVLLLFLVYATFIASLICGKCATIWLNINVLILIFLMIFVAILPILLFAPIHVKKIRINFRALEIALEY